MTDYAIVTTTVADAESAKRLARALVEGRMAACVQVSTVESVYRWRGSVGAAQEQLLTCKVKASTFQAVETFIRSNHAYDIPEILMTPVVAGSNAYLEWLEEELTGL